MSKVILSDEEFWDDIFSGVRDVSPLCLPVKYIDYVSIIFKNGKEMEITVDHTIHTWEHIHSTVIEFLKIHEHNVSKVGYLINVDNIKTDIATQTTNFLKKYKL